MNAITAETLRSDMLRKAQELPLEELDVSNWHLMQNDAIWPYFERLRTEDPVHYHPTSRYGPFWSITRFDDIKQVDQNHKVFSSEAGGIGILDLTLDDSTPFMSFISMDEPKHAVQRKVVSPVVAPRNLADMEAVIRERAGNILDGLPVGETFNWGRPGVDRADHADARDPVQLPVRRPPQAHPLVGRDVHARIDAGAATQGDARLPGVLHRAVAPASRSAAELRSHLSADSRRGHAGSREQPDGVSRQHPAADRQAATTPRETRFPAACWRSTGSRRSTTSSTPITA